MSALQTQAPLAKTLSGQPNYDMGGAVPWLDPPENLGL